MTAGEGRWDAIVVGCGTAGMPVALELAARGGRVLVLEGSSRIGGTLHVSSGHMSAAGTRLQRARGIDDTPDDHFADVMRISRGTADPAMVRLATRHAASAIDWLVDNGFDMGPECPVIAYSHEPYLVPRTYWGRDKGRSILAVLARLFEPRVAAGDIALALSTRLVGLAREGGAWVARAEGPAGARRVERARSVVLATGGHGANAALFSRVTGGMPLLSPAPSTADGSGLEIALGLGGVLRNGDIFLPTLAGVPDAPGGHWLDWDHKPVLTPQHRAPWEIYVDARGARFVAEDDPSPDARERALKRQPGLAFWIVYDGRMAREAPPLYPTWTPARMDAAFASHPAFVRAGSLGELARACGMDGATLARTVAGYNEAVASGRDALGRRHMPAPLAEPPFAAIRHQGVTLRCWAGLAVDDRLAVRRADGSTIDGLHAVGEILGGATMSGDSFASGMSITPALALGRLLGREILPVGG